MLQISHLSADYGGKPALADINLTLESGELLVVLGPSGCGKTTLLNLIAGFVPYQHGSITLEGQRVTGPGAERGVVFQNEGLLPWRNVQDNVALGLQLAGVDKAQRRQAAAQMLKKVGLEGAEKRFIWQLSGGQRQRVGIARALSLQPQFIVCDEPVSSLDVSIQAQVLNLLKDLQAEFHLTYLFITHDLSVVKFFSDKIAVMYLGQLVETADSAELFRQPLHPYSQALLSAIPIPSSRQKMQRVKLIGELQSPIDPEPGCRFAKRCLYAREGCTGRDLALRDFGSGHFCACCRAGALEEQTPSK